MESRKVGAKAREVLREAVTCKWVRRSVFQHFLCAAALLAAAASSVGQSPQGPPEQEATPPLSSNGPTESPAPNPPASVSVHGIVKNAVTGDPLPRALIQVNGEIGPGTLTDGDGKFEILVPGYGEQVFQLAKPGFHDLPPNSSGNGTLIENTSSMGHSVFVVPDMQDLVFTLSPTGAIRGRIDLTTGDPGQGIGVQLLRRVIQGGHAIWRAAASTRTNSDGAYRFAGLDEGDYAIGTDSARDSDSVGGLVEKNSETKVAWSGFAATFYPDAREFSGAARIRVRGGETAQANLTLRLEPFHLVRAILLQARDTDKSVVDYSASVLDTQGHSLPYGAQYDPETRTVQAMLPDGAYSLQVTAVKRLHQGLVSLNSMTPIGVMLQGTADFNVAGHSISNLPIALSQKVANPLTVSVIHNSATTTASREIRGGGVFVSVSQAGNSLVDGMWSQLAQGPVPGQIETNVLAPGSYWVHTSVGQPGLCESSFTAGGASLAREPLIIGPGGSPPMTLTLREDCATLKLNLAPNLMSQRVGEEPVLTVYVVPDFDSTGDVVPLTLRPLSGGTFTLESLTPGSYHVYTFSAPVALEYHNPDVLAALAGQSKTVTLEPTSPSTLVLEAPAP